VKFHHKELGIKQLAKYMNETGKVPVVYNAKANLKIDCIFEGEEIVEKPKPLIQKIKETVAPTKKTKKKKTKKKVSKK